MRHPNINVIASVHPLLTRHLCEATESLINNEQLVAEK